MKRFLLLFVLASGLLVADVAENKEFCTQLNMSLPSVFKVGLDAFAIRDGNVSKCEDHTREEWQDIGITAQYGFLYAVDAGMIGANDNPKNSACVYERFVENAIKNRAYDIDEMKYILEEIKKECE